MLQSRISTLVEEAAGKDVNERTMNFLVGMGAGVCNGAVLSPLAAVKYHSWGKEGARFLETARGMAANGGVRPFFKAINATAVRDMTFGCVYEVGRVMIRRSVGSYWHGIEGSREKERSGQHQSETVAAVANMTAAGLATGLSAPLNYARNMKLATPATQTPPTTAAALRDLWRDTIREPGGLPRKASFLQERLRVGWGTARVAVGMAMGQWLFDRSRGMLASIFSSQERGL